MAEQEASGEVAISETVEQDRTVTDQQATVSDTQQPTDSDTQQPTDGDTQQPTDGDTQQPTDGDTQQPTDGDAQQPTDGDTQQPTEGDTQQPTDGDTQQPTDGDTQQPTDGDTQQPTDGDTQQPTDGDTQQPIDGDTQQPTYSDTQQPTDGDTQQPTDGDTQQPTDSDTQQPADNDTQQAAVGDIQQPTDGDAQQPTDGDTQQPTDSDTQQPTDGDIRQPTDGDIQKPTVGNTKQSTNGDTQQPTNGDTQQPTNGDTQQPTDPMATNITKEQTEEEEEQRIPDDFYYKYDEHVSRPIIENMPDDVLTLHSSLGYECQRQSNLFVMDINTIMFIAGNIVEMVDLTTKQHRYLRSLSGGGIGALTVHPSRQFFAVGEKGHLPHICIYSYPDLRLYRLLREGTEQAYSDLDFSSATSDGKLLASVGSSPDYMLTVWDWRQEKVVLRSKAFSQEVYRVTFSPDNEGQLTTSGTGHIRFWKMASTFTGLKLQGELGKFGRTELSDISAYVELPDGKVLSGSELGIMLLWDGGFIKVELAKKGKKPCHNGNIEAIFLDEGELITTGVDGFVRVWDFETIDNADISEDNSVFEMEPLTEIKVGSDVSLKSLTRSADEHNPHLWYGQDANGAIWKIDIVVSHTRKSPERIITYHSGEIRGLDTAPAKNLVASISTNGSVRVHNCDTSELLCHNKFTGGGASLLWAPINVDPSGQTLITGYGDGVLRVLLLQHLDDHHRKPTTSLSPARSGLAISSALTLSHVCKPHNSSMTCLAVDNDGTILATGGADSTVFFLSIKNKYEPVGFINTPATVTSLQWSTATPPKLLVCCEDGAMLEVMSPLKDCYNTSKTYLLEPLKYTCQHFSSVKDKIKRAKEEAARNAEKERKRKEREARLKKKKEKEGEDAVLSEEEEEEEEEPVIEEQTPPGISPILTGFYHYPEPNKTFWLTMGGYDTGYIYQCSMDGASDDGAPYEPQHVVPLPPYNGEDRSLTSVYISHKGQHLLTGMDNGVIRIHPLTLMTTNTYSITDLTTHWTVSMHDNDHGRVTRLVCTYDDQYVISAGADGNLFVYKFNSQLEPPPVPTTGVVDDQVSSPSEDVTDIEDPKAYSIEDAKQKAERDRKMKLAEEKKQRVRQEVSGLRRQFYQVLMKSKELPAHLHLTHDEFILDPEMEEMLANQTKEKVELVHKEMAWEKGKSCIARQKLQRKFKDVLECERIVVWSMENSGDHVASYRAPAPSPEFLTLIQHCTGRSELLPSTATTLGGTSVPGTSTTSDITSPAATGGQFPTLTTTIDKKASSKALSKMEAKRLKRELRTRQWGVLLKRKPDDKFEDPHDAEVLRIAKETIGDYKLKSSKDYVVPEDQQVTTDKKRQELLFLRNKLFDYRRHFNKMLVALRDRKVEDVAKIEQLLTRVKTLQRSLPADKRLPIPPTPKLRPEEVPERRTQYDDDRLLQFKVELAAKQEAEQRAQAGTDEFGGFGGFGGAPPPTATEEETESVTKEQVEAIGSSTATTSISSMGGIPTSDAHVSKLEAQCQQEQIIKMEYEQSQCLEEVKHLVDNFNHDLCHLRHYKYHQDVVLKTAELRHITLFEELELLKEFEKRETTFISRYQSKKSERKELDKKINELQKQLHRKDQELSRHLEEEKVLHNNFSEAVGEGNKFRDFLIVRVFRKKIKRAKKKPQETEGAGDDGSSSEESDSDELSSSDDDSDSAEGDKMDDSVCPPGCDQDLFDLACDMREKRMDIEELIAEERKSLDLLKKEVEGLKKKLKVMDTGVKAALSDLQGFQLEKLQKLNELDQVVVMKLHQILHYGPDGAPPTSVGACLVFPAPAWSRLQTRIGELQHEKQDERKHYKELRLRHVKLVREKKEMMAMVSELEEKSKEMMMLKFGRVVDLAQLENLTVNKLAEELQRKIRQHEQAANKELAQLKMRMEQVRDELMAVTRQNTRRLNMMTELLQTQKQLDNKLNQRQRKMEVSLQGQPEEETMEQQRLQHLVTLQSQEIMALKDEIRTLSHKGGHVLPPTQPPMAATAASTSGIHPGLLH